METKIEEIWKDIIGYEGIYQISNLGQVTSNYTNSGNCTNSVKLRRLSTDKDGYKFVTLTKNKKKFHCQIHRALLIHFKGPVKDKPFVNHINGIKDDNRLCNLEWCSAKENTIHAYNILGIKGPIGSKSHFSKLTDRDVILIRNMKGFMTMRDIGKRFGIHRATVSYILSEKTWRHLL